jgi:hypothetical protein
MGEAKYWREKVGIEGAVGKGKIVEVSSPQQPIL